MSQFLLQSRINLEIAISDQQPNWLCCSTCLAPIAKQHELHEHSQETLTQAVYTYLLEILGVEVPVYSATNTHDHRFDVVRVSLDESVGVPSVSSENRSTGFDREVVEVILRRLQHSSGDQLRPFADPETARHLLDELDEMQGDAQDTSGEEISDDSEHMERPNLFNVFAGRLVSMGEPTEEFSWFPGFFWTIASCRICDEHLGWIFHASDKTIAFQTLIVTKLREKYIAADNSELS
jgi:hypothetical protein